MILFFKDVIRKFKERRNQI